MIFLFLAVSPPMTSLAIFNKINKNVVVLSARHGAKCFSYLSAHNPLNSPTKWAQYDPHSELEEEKAKECLARGLEAPRVQSLIWNTSSLSPT